MGARDRAYEHEGRAPVACFIISVYFLFSILLLFLVTRRVPKNRARRLAKSTGRVGGKQKQNTNIINPGRLT